jgi:hypothetical protein
MTGAYGEMLAFTGEERRLFANERGFCAENRP